MLMSKLRNGAFRFEEFPFLKNLFYHVNLVGVLLNSELWFITQKIFVFFLLSVSSSSDYSTHLDSPVKRTSQPWKVPHWNADILMKC